MLFLKLCYVLCGAAIYKDAKRPGLKMNWPLRDTDHVDGAILLCTGTGDVAHTVGCSPNEKLSNLTEFTAENLVENLERRSHAGVDSQLYQP